MFSRNIVVIETFAQPEKKTTIWTHTLTAPYGSFWSSGTIKLHGLLPIHSKEVSENRFMLFWESLDIKLLYHFIMWMRWNENMYM